MTQDQGQATRHRPMPGRWTSLGLAAALTAALAVPLTTGGAAAAYDSSSVHAVAGRALGTASAPLGGALRAWGENGRGQLGDGVVSLASDLPVRVKLPAGTLVASVRAGDAHSLARTTTGRLLAWGDNTHGQLGDGSTTERNQPVQVKLAAGIKVAAARAGGTHSLALTTSGQALAWGLNSNGQLGDGTTTDRHRPVKVKLPRGTTVTAISAGCSDSFAVTATGRLLAWGDNTHGQLGDGTTIERNRPVKVQLPGGTRVSAVSAGCDHTLAVTTTGHVLAWGRNDGGELGDGTTMDSPTPVQINFLLRGPPIGMLRSLFAGGGFSIALFSSGAMLAWGNNFWGELGDGTTTNSDIPVRVQLPTGTKVTAISAGFNDSYALTTDGRVLAWGFNLFGQLGNGTTTSSDLPVTVHLGPGLVATAIGAGPSGFHSFAIVHKRP